MRLGCYCMPPDVCQCEGGHSFALFLIPAPAVVSLNAVTGVADSATAAEMMSLSSL